MLHCPSKLLLLFLHKGPQVATFLLLILSNDIELNPGLNNNHYFTFMNWNCNSLAKENFQRMKFIEAQNSIFNYDIISLCETSLNNQVTLPDPESYLNNEYTFISVNKPDNTRHGGELVSSKKILYP